MTALKPIEKYVTEMRAGKPSIEGRVEDLFNAVNSFWRAVRIINPACFENSADYVLQKTPRIFALSQLCLAVMKDMTKGRRDWSEKEFQHMLSSCEKIAQASMWAGGDGEFAKYVSMKGFAEIAGILEDSYRE